MLNVAMLSVTLLNVFMLNVAMLSVTLLNVVMHNVAMLSVVFLNVVAPIKELKIDSLILKTSLTLTIKLDSNAH